METLFGFILEAPTKEQKITIEELQQQPDKTTEYWAKGKTKIRYE